MHFVRNAGGGPHRERLTERLLHRVFLLAPRAEDSDGATVSLTKANIRDDVVDHFIDLLLSDRTAYDDRLDYYEINFNSAIAKDRKDASDRHWKRDCQSEELCMDDGGVSNVLEAVIDGYDPFDPQVLDEKFYRLRLDEEIDSLPELQRRIVEMWRQEIPIDSQDPTVVTISKALGKSEKTIRTAPASHRRQRGRQRPLWRPAKPERRRARQPPWPARTRRPHQRHSDHRPTRRLRCRFGVRRREAAYRDRPGVGARNTNDPAG